MQKFIRIDTKGHWKGNEHCSTVAMEPDYWGEETEWEQGISCYSFAFGQADALEELRKYWLEYVDSRLETYEDMQVTIFEGEELDVDGACGESMAVCYKTLKEFDAKPFLEKIDKIHKPFWYEEIDEDEYMERLEKVEL